MQFSIGSFFMIEDREQALKEITHVTRTNGFFGIAEPMCRSLLARKYSGKC